MRARTLLQGIVALAAGVLLADVASAASIAGSRHDFSAKGWGSTELCIFCHAPHNANVTAGTLWNHAVTAATYTLYTSTTLNATLAQPAAGAPSKLCLSCHDGTVAIDSFQVGGAMRTGTVFATGAVLVGTDLSNDHPIGFVYDAALVTADAAGGSPGLVVPASTSQVSANVPLYASKVECSSCHNVHDPVNGNFLRVSNTGSALCLKCHIK